MSSQTSQVSSLTSPAISRPAQVWERLKWPNVSLVERRREDWIEAIIKLRDSRWKPEWDALVEPFDWQSLADRAAVEVPAHSLDGHLQQLGRTPAFIQIDVGGAEMSVLRGAEGLLRRARPKLLIEVHGWETGTREEVSGFLSRFGYTGDVVGRRGHEGFLSMMCCGRRRASRHYGIDK